MNMLRDSHGSRLISLYMQQDAATVCAASEAAHECAMSAPAPEIAAEYTRDQRPWRRACTAILPQGASR